MWDGHNTQYLDIFASEFVFWPVRDIVVAPISFANSTALIIFLLSPEVEKLNNISFAFKIPSICLEKILLKPKSFPAAVITDESVVRAIAGNDFLFFEVSAKENTNIEDVFKEIIKNLIEKNLATIPNYTKNIQNYDTYVKKNNCCY